jgi:hypothetical protein
VITFGINDSAPNTSLEPVQARQRLDILQGKKVS